MTFEIPIPKCCGLDMKTSKEQCQCTGWHTYGREDGHWPECGYVAREKLSNTPGWVCQHRGHVRTDQEVRDEYWNERIKAVENKLDELSRFVYDEDSAEE